MEAKPYGDLSTFLQWPCVENYTALRYRLEKSNASFLPGNKFFKTRELLVGTAYNGVPGCFEKEANSNFLRMLEQSLKDKNGRFMRTAYVYYSDIFAAEPLRSSDHQFVRIERHSGKKFAILRLGTRHDNPLTNAEREEDQKIVFNLWQFIKHIAPSETEGCCNILSCARMITSTCIVSLMYWSESIITHGPASFLFPTTSRIMMC